MSETSTKRDERSAAKLWARFYRTLAANGYEKRGIDTALAAHWDTNVQAIQKFKTGVANTPFYRMRDLVKILHRLGDDDAHLEDVVTTGRTVANSPEKFLETLTKRSE